MIDHDNKDKRELRACLTLWPVAKKFKFILNDQSISFSLRTAVVGYHPSTGCRGDTRPARGSELALFCLTLSGPAAAKRQPSGAPATRNGSQRETSAFLV